MTDDPQTTFNRRFLAYFAVGLTAAAMAYIACITFITIPEKNVRFADTVLGFLLGTLLGTLISFFYGSSKSSQAKDDALQAQLVSTAPAAPVKVDDSTPINVKEVTTP